MPQASPVMNVMIAAARKAARALARDFGEVENLQVSRKGPSDFVSAADLKAEKTLFEDLSKARPGYGFVMEERGVVEGTDKTNRWLVDPLDGTSNFLHAIPHWAISIALEREGALIAGVIYNVVRDELFWAEKGTGAYLNDKRLRVAARSDMRDALFATGTPFHGRPGHDVFLKEVERVISARPCLRGRRPLRRLLGTRAKCVGRRRGRRARARSGRGGHRARRRRFHENRRYPCVKHCARAASSANAARLIRVRRS
jgi:fructose-1,6-bisphosphatase/inositol monophosphatase family enzyme